MTTTTQPTPATALDREVARVLAADACSGCGACTQLDAGLTMRLDDAGFLRPVRVAPGDAAPDAAARFRRACPGSRVEAPVTAAPRHALLGPVLGAWRAWAADDEIRWSGSSGGVLTALAAWLAESGDPVGPVLGCAQDAGAARRTVSVRITTREEALAASGSRYAPVAAAGARGALDPAAVVVGKPCEASAVRALTGADAATAPLVLSFFCAGTPSQHATDAVLGTLAVEPATELASLRYRGRGWPGRFAARTVDGRDVSTTYDESWGAHLGRAVQWRCKICPDGIGESSDITAGDLWRTDERGYPAFTEGDGTSALLARTPRGLAVVERAVAAGVLVVEPVDPDEIAGIQPLQRTRRQTLVGRLVGARLAGRSVPTYRGFGLTRLALGRWRETLRAGRGTYRRLRAAGSAGTASSTASPTPAARP